MQLHTASLFTGALSLLGASLNPARAYTIERRTIHTPQKHAHPLPAAQPEPAVHEHPATQHAIGQIVLRAEEGQQSPSNDSTSLESRHRRHHDKRLLNLPLPLGLADGAPTLSDGARLPYKRWDFEDSSLKVYGVNLGNYFLLERWMDEEWFTSQAGTNAWDMYSFMKNLGAEKAAAVLNEHYSTFYNELDLTAIATAGANHIRIPMGYWSWIPVEGDEPFRDNGEVGHLTKLLTDMAALGMHATIDLHGMPGSQSTDQATGWANPNPQWFTPAQQARSDQLLDKIIDYIKTSPVGSVISSVLVVNEPCGPGGCNDSQRDVLRGYYDRAYAKLSAAEIPMIFHSGFVPGGLHAWVDWAAGKDRRYLVSSDNPYPGGFPPKSDGPQLLQTVCHMATSYANLPFKVVVGEWSLVSGLHHNDFQREYYATQAGGWARSAGSTFWSYRVKPASNVSGGINMSKEAALQWSWKDAHAAGLVPSPTLGQHTNSFLADMPNQKC